MTAVRPATAGGRPKKAEGEGRAIVAGVRMTVAEREYARGLARQAGLSLSEFLRRRALGMPVVVRQGKSDAALVHELNAIGVNLNQLTANVNADRLGAVGCRLEDLDGLTALLRKTLHKALDALDD